MLTKKPYNLLRMFVKKPKGFTLLEMLVALGIFALFIGSITVIMTDAFKNNAVVWKQLQRQSEGRKVVRQVVDDLRKAEQSSTGAYSIESAGVNEIRFYSNLDNDGYIEKVRYFLIDTTLKKGVIKPSGNPLTYNSANEQIVELAHYVNNIDKNMPLFLYYDQNYSGTENALVQPVVASSVKMVRVQLELEDDPTKTPVALVVQGLAGIRNLKNN